MAEKMINLGRKDTCCCAPETTKKGEERIYYPSLYISGVKGLDLDTGEITFTAKGKVVSLSKRDRDGKPETSDEEYSCEIEVHEIAIPGAKKADTEDSGDKLGKALDEISKKKAMPEEPMDEEDDEEE